MRKRRGLKTGSWASMGLQGAKMAMDAQHVIMQRLTRFALGAPDASREASLMVSEKMKAMADSQRLMLSALSRGKAGKGAQQIMNLYSRKVSANRKRLSKKR